MATETAQGRDKAHHTDPGVRDSRPAALRSRYSAATPRVVGLVAAALGAVSVISGLWPQRWHALYQFTTVLPAPATATADALVVVSGVLLMRVAAGLRKRKRAEWRIAVVICVILTVASLLRDERRPIMATVALLLLISLLLARSRFTARTDVRSRWFAVRVGLQFFVVAVVYGMVLLLMPGRVVAPASVWERLREVLLSLIGLGGSIRLQDDRFADFFYATLLTFGLLTATCVVVLLLRTAQPLANLSPDDELRLRSLLDRQGRRDSLGYFALRRDKSAVWSASGKAAITYRVICGVALVSGDPIGDPEAWPGAIAAYRELVEQYGWTPAAMCCSELGATVFKREYGLSALSIGDEAILARADFALDGRAMRGVRQACTRVARAGYTLSVRRVADLTAAEIDELRAAAVAWRGDAVERGYSMALSRIGDPDDGGCVVAVARHEGRLRGLLHFVPWGVDGLSLDLMRRARDSDNGLNEAMITAIMQACGDLQVDRVSLNFAMFRDAFERGERIGAGPVLRLWRRALLVASRFWQMDSLFRFNAKFQPQWQPRFVSYASARDLPRITVAALEAEAFIVRPNRLNKLLGR